MLHYFNAGSIDRDEMIKQTIRHGFIYVLDAFHNVHCKKIDAPFFVDVHISSNSMRITDGLFQLGEQSQFSNLEQETGHDGGWLNRREKIYCLVTSALCSATICSANWL
jgi:hypothetical protein